MRSKILVRILIVLLAALLIFRIHQRVETYRVPREMCRTQLSVLAEANVRHIFEYNGIPAPTLDSLLTYARDAGFFETSMTADSISVVHGGQTRTVPIPDSWRNLWNAAALREIEAELDSVSRSLSAVTGEIASLENERGISFDSLISLREIFIAENPLEDGLDPEDDDSMTPGDIYDDSLGFSPTALRRLETGLSASRDSLAAALRVFNDSIAPARKDSVSLLVIGVCPVLWESGYVDSLYSYDPRLALGTQYWISCPNIDRHGGVVGGFVPKDYPDSVFLEPDWSQTQLVYPFPRYAEIRRQQASRSNLLRAAEEQAAYLGQRYPAVIIPRSPENLDMGIDHLTDPLGGEYVFELLVDSTYVFHENPLGRTARARGDSVTVETKKFVGYTTADPDSSRVEVFFARPLTFPSRADGASVEDNDRVTVILFWETEDDRVDERDVDLLDEPTWDFVSTRFGSAETD